MKYGAQLYHGLSQVTEINYFCLIREQQPPLPVGKQVASHTNILSFVDLHPQAVNHPDIQTCRAFMGWVGMGTDGQIEERPTVRTMPGFFRQFSTCLKRERNIESLSSTTRMINEVRTYVYLCVLKGRGLIFHSLFVEN